MLVPAETRSCLLALPPPCQGYGARVDAPVSETLRDANWPHQFPVAVSSGVCVSHRPLARNRILFVLQLFKLLIIHW